MRITSNLALALAFIVGCGEPHVDEAPLAYVPTPDYVGADACAACHVNAFDAWGGSHHAQAMQPATDDTVLGDFDDAAFTYNGVTTRFSRFGDEFIVQTDGPDGDFTSYPVTHTFGVDPLQQYLAELEPGRLQALSIAWDARPEGQQWFHLYPDDVIDHEDALHWTKMGQNWSSMCADCHSTNVAKNFDPERNTFDTTYSSISVGCEACHGPGSLHVSAPDHGYGAAAADIDTCAPCHSRRAQIAEGYRPGLALLDFYRPVAISPPLYHADGQILDEVYVYGSFVQSKMYARGVTCSDCHDPHTAQTRLEGNALCTQCHSQSPRTDFPTLVGKTYDDPSHHFHEGARCVDCHMPSRVYMGVDERHDHGFRIPRPDLTATYEVPNACNSCHDDRTPQWARDEIAERVGADPVPGFADALAHASTQHFDAERALTDIANNTELSGLVRASALVGLGAYEFGYSQDAIAAGLRDANPQVRLGALQNIARLPEAPRFGAVKRLLVDPVRAVRIEAGLFAAAYLTQSIAVADRALIESVVREYIDAQTLQGERPQAHTNIATVRAAAGDTEGAKAALMRALERQPNWVPALVNLADIYRLEDRDVEGREYLARAVAVEPPSGDAAYAYGLWLIRNDQPARALEQLRRAREIDPGHMRNAYVYALALNSVGQRDEAINLLRSSLARFGRHRAILEALTTFHRERAEIDAALAYAGQLAELFGAGYEQLAREIESERSP